MKDYRTLEQTKIIKDVPNEKLQVFLWRYFEKINYYSAPLSMSAFYDNLENQYMRQYSAIDLEIVQRLVKFMKFHTFTQQYLVALLCIQFQKSPHVLLQELRPLFQDFALLTDGIFNYVNSIKSLRFPANQVPVNFVEKVSESLNGSQNQENSASIFIPDILVGQNISLRSTTTHLPDLITPIQKPLLSSAREACSFRAPTPCTCQNCAETAMEQMLELIDSLKEQSNFMGKLNYLIETSLKFTGCRCAFKVLTANFQYHHDFSLLKDINIKNNTKNDIKTFVADALFPYIDVTLIIDYKKRNYMQLNAPQNLLLNIRCDNNQETRSLVQKLRNDYGIEDIYTAPYSVIRLVEQGMKKTIRQYRVMNPYYPFIFINECFTCKCTTSCMFRNVQLKQLPKLFVKFSNQTQFGVYCDELIPRGHFVSEYPGIVHTDSQAENIGYFQDSIRCSYLFDQNLDALLLDQNDDGLSIDAARVGNVSRFFNHSSKPNLYQKFVFWDDDGPTPYGQLGLCHICLFACEDIWPGTELCFDYEYQRNPEVHDLYPWAFQGKD